jgi:hypothetical protein
VSRYRIKSNNPALTDLVFSSKRGAHEFMKHNSPKETYAVVAIKSEVTDVVRYENKRFYCAEERRYVSLCEMGHWVQRDKKFRVLSHRTGNELTGAVILRISAQFVRLDTQSTIEIIKRAKLPPFGVLRREDRTKANWGFFHDEP